MSRAPRTVSLEEAADLVRPDDTLAVPLGPGQPTAFLHALGARAEFDDLQVFAALLVDAFPLFVRPGVRLLSGFFGPVERGLLASGHAVEFVPGDFRGFAAILEQLEPRVMVTVAAPPDAGGRCSLALHAGASVAELKRAGRDPERLLVVEVNPALPRTRGLDVENPHALRLDEIDFLVESDRDVFTLPDPSDSQVARIIARHASTFVGDGATLQTGIGSIPNDVAALLAEGEGGDYGVHSEMFTTGLMRLHRAGKVTNRKGVYDGFSVTTFAAGTRELYDWLDGNDDVRFLPVHLVNDPSVIARNRDMVSINGALSVDLAGQLAADTLDGRQFSGIGGHEDFVAGAHRSGRSLICLPSTAGSGDAQVSRIVPAFPPGTLVTTPRHHSDVVITEWGVADLAGKTVRERRDALVGVAHPDFRDALAAADPS